MTRSNMLWVLAVGLLSAGGCAKQEFKEFNNPAGRYKVQFPGKPTEETKSAAGMTMYIASVQQKNGAYLVSYADLPISGNESAEELEARLDGSRNGALGNIKAKLTKETKIKFGKHAGRDIEADMPDQKGAIHMKLCIVGKRIYQTMSVGSTTWTSSDDSAKFLNSFELIE